MSVLSAAMLLFLVMDPIGAVPVFTALLKGVPPGRQSWVVLRENLVALATLLCFLFFGPTVLRWLHIQEPALNIAGGLVLLIVALEMIFPGRGGPMSLGSAPGEPFIVPLAIPLIAGPSTMATLMLMVTRDPTHRGAWLIALLAAWATGAMILLAATRLHDVLGRRGLAALERLMGMILVVVAVQMSLTGIEQFIEQAGR